MPATLMNWANVSLNPDDGALSLILNGNVDTTIMARCWWYPDTQGQAANSKLIAAGEPYVLPLATIHAGKLRRLGFAFAATPVTPQISHLFVQLTVQQATAQGVVLARTYEETLPAGHNKWKLSDGMTLIV